MKNIDRTDVLVGLALFAACLVLYVFTRPDPNRAEDAAAQCETQMLRDARDSETEVTAVEAEQVADTLYLATGYVQGGDDLARAFRCEVDWLGDGEWSIRTLTYGASR